MITYIYITCTHIEVRFCVGTPLKAFMYPGHQAALDPKDPALRPWRCWKDPTEAL